jgi:hypothetical protein
LQNGGIKKIDNVLVVPGMTKNLLLVGTCANKRCFVIFGLKKCWVLIIVTPKKRVARGVRDDQAKWALQIGVFLIILHVCF